MLKTEPSRFQSYWKNQIQGLQKMQKRSVNLYELRINYEYTNECVNIGFVN
jgi:hypothetical protein